MTDFATLLPLLLISEYGYSEEDAAAAVKANPSIVVQGIMTGPMALRGCAMAIDHAWKISHPSPGAEIVK